MRPAKDQNFKCAEHIELIIFIFTEIMHNLDFKFAIKNLVI